MPEVNPVSKSKAEHIESIFWPKTRLSLVLQHFNKIIKYTSHTDSIYTNLSLQPFDCTRNSPYRHLTKCRSYRSENL